eukprot:13568474-Alexandrium_andersonii.AAC.1
MTDWMLQAILPLWAVHAFLNESNKVKTRSGNQYRQGTPRIRWRALYVEVSFPVLFRQWVVFDQRL